MPGNTRCNHRSLESLNSEKKINPGIATAGSANTLPEEEQITETGTQEGGGGAKNHKNFKYIHLNLRYKDSKGQEIHCQKKKVTYIKKLPLNNINCTTGNKYLLHFRLLH